MFQFPRFASSDYGFVGRWPKRAGFSHSEIHGSKGARPSPRLIATCYVLHRLSVPRHPPNALIALDPKLLKRHAQRQVPAPFALYFGHSALFRIADRRHLGRHTRHHLRTKTTGARTSRKDPAYGQPHFPIHDVKDRDELAIAVGQRPSIVRQLAIPSYSPNSVPLGSRPLSAPIVGGADRTRTGDPLLAKQVLSQLSYSPIQIPRVSDARCQII